MPEILEFEKYHIKQALELWAATEHIGLSSADETASISLFLERNQGFNFVAMGDTELAGAVLCGHDGRRGYVYHLGVCPDYRRQGLGTALLEASLGALEKVNVQKCHAAVFDSSPYGDRFWESLGWQRRNDLRVYSASTAVHSQITAKGKNLGYSRQ